eukprot:1138237-Pelagomonas_calceolata.AAC.4
MALCPRSTLSCLRILASLLAACPHFTAFNVFTSPLTARLHTGVLITPQAAAAAGMRLPDSRLVAAAKRGIADQLQAAQAGPGDEDGDQDDDEDEDEEEEAGGRAGLSSPRSASAAVYEERQRRMKAEQQAVWRQRARAWRGEFCR